MWGKMDDKFHRNRKVRELRKRGKAGNEALGVWTFWWSWCLDDPELNGEIPRSELSKRDETASKLLVEVGLWDETDDGFIFHDFHSYNPTREQVDSKRQADRERVLAKRKGKSDDVASDISATRERTESESQESPTRVASTRDPVPSRPVLDPPLPPEGKTAPSDPPQPSGGSSGAHGLEVREGWAEAYELAEAGAPPVLAGQRFAAAVEFARNVARAHQKPLRTAAKAIAVASLRLPLERRQWALSELDPYAAANGASAAVNLPRPEDPWV